MPTRESKTLRDELSQLDTQVTERIRQLEAWVYELNPGVPFPLGPDYCWDKLAGKWRFLTTDDEPTPLDSVPRGERAEFLGEWTKQTIETALVEALKEYIASRKSVLNE
jgi:hypothetical protein